MSSWGFSMADLNTCLNVLDAICDNPQLLEEPAIRATGVRQLINPTMLDRPAGGTPKQDFRVSGGAPIPGGAFKAVGGAKYGAASPSPSAAPPPTSNGHTAYGQSQPAKYGAAASTSAAPKGGMVGGNAAPKYGGGGGAAAHLTDPKALPSTPASSQTQSRNDPPPKSDGGTRTHGKYCSGAAPVGSKAGGTMSAVTAAGYAPEKAPAPSEASHPRHGAAAPQQPKYGAHLTDSAPRAAVDPSRTSMATAANSASTLNSKLKQGSKAKELSFSPKAPAEGYDHLWW